MKNPRCGQVRPLGTTTDMADPCFGRGGPLPDGQPGKTGTFYPNSKNTGTVKTYPSIGHEVVDQPVYAFDKLDGSNIRAEWSKKRGFWKFGSRTQLIDASTPIFGESISIILEKYGEELSKAFREQRWQKATAFFEFHGPGSFAGSHVPEDEKTVTLFDVAGDKKGILEPADFLRLAERVETAALLFRGHVSDEFLQEVKEGRLEGMTFEGVICKGKTVTPGLPLMFKVKNQAWIDRLRARCQGNEDLFNKLS